MTQGARVCEDLTQFRQVPHGRPGETRPDFQPCPCPPEVQAAHDRYRLPVLFRPTHGIPLHAKCPLEFHQQLLARHRGI